MESKQNTMNTIETPFQNEGYWFDCQKDNPSVDQQSDEEIDILGSDATCCNCKKSFYIPNFFHHITTSIK